MKKTPHKQKTFFGHPRGLSSLFLTEFCERFSYYGMRAILTYFLYFSVASGGLGLQETEALTIMSCFGSLVYLTSVIGGWAADRILGAYRATLYGGIIIAAGHIILALPLGIGGMFVALGCIIIGTGFLKPNVSEMVGELYAEGDNRRDAGYSIYYMGINLGSFLSPIIVGSAHAAFGFHFAFFIPAVIMIAALFVFVFHTKKTIGVVSKKPLRPLQASEKKKLALAGVALVSLVVVVVAVLALTGNLTVSTVEWMLPLVCLIIVVSIFTTILRNKGIQPVERKRVFAFIPLFVCAAVFFAIAEQQASTIALIVESKIDSSIGNFTVPAAWYQSINPLVILACTPVLAFLWMKLKERQPTIISKMGIGIFLAALGFFTLAAGNLITPQGSLLNPAWVIVCIVLFSVGELLVSPIGLSATSKLAPKFAKSQMMALWMLANSLGQGLNGFLVQFYSEATAGMFFIAYASVAVVAGVLMFAGKRFLLALADGVH
ncbi:MAG: oligopeptide:H+ symporter [Coriobacteriales bacterium]|jgi:POT family proton-dependent oligopeptide transporter|nr:oligopeptide:H+ symporter [Coriobacteriales bacterium]